MEPADISEPSLLASVAGDVHLWVPTVVLISGLLLLRWVS